MDYVLSINTFTTFALTGLIWLIQVVHYPLFQEVGAKSFPVYHRNHVRRITPLVLSLMTCEIISSAMLAMRSNTLCMAFVLCLGTWITTFAIHVPLHRQLAKQFDEKLISKLVQTNWIRTVLWTLRSAILAALFFS